MTEISPLEMMPWGHENSCFCLLINFRAVVPASITLPSGGLGVLFRAPFPPLSGTPSAFSGVCTPPRGGMLLAPFGPTLARAGRASPSPSFPLRFRGRSVLVDIPAEVDGPYPPMSVFCCAVGRCRGRVASLFPHLPLLPGGPHRRTRLACSVPVPTPSLISSHFRCTLPWWDATRWCGGGPAPSARSHHPPHLCSPPLLRCQQHGSTAVGHGPWHSAVLPLVCFIGESHVFDHQPRRNRSCDGRCCRSSASGGAGDGGLHYLARRRWTRCAGVLLDRQLWRWWCCVADASNGV